jgi:ATP-dependent Lon protease
MFQFETTAEIDCHLGVLGQDTARDALIFGIECDAPGQNIYVRGSRGTGRGLMVHQLLKKLAPKSNEKRDYCYVHHFKRPDHPRLISLPPGTAHDFRRKIGELAEFVQEGLLKALGSEPYESKRNAIQEETQQKVEQVSGPLEKELAENGMSLVSVQNTPRPMTMIFPVVEGQPVPLDQLRALVLQHKAPEQQLKDFESAYPAFQKKLQEVSREVADLFMESRNRIDQIHEAAAREMLSAIIDPILVKFTDPSVKSFIDEIVNNTIEYHLKPRGEDEEVDLKEVYGVNVVLCQTDKTARPVIVESAPSMINLLGTVEPKWGPGGIAVSDYRGIRAGALLNADQGYLVLDVNDLLSEPGAWRALMRTLRTKRLEIVPPEAGWMRQYVVTQPEPIEVQVRVILIGDVITYYQLDQFDPDFRELFKVLADFDNEIVRDEQGAFQYACVVAGLTQTDSLPHFHKTAVAALVEHGSRIVARSGKLTAKFGRIADIAREAAFLATQEDGAAALVMDHHVKKSVRRTKARASLPSRKFQEMVENRTILLETEGAVVGQINGLAVMHSGPLTYGFPARITATIGPGTAGLINIEGRAQMSGAIHTKGFHILGGLLRHLLDTDHPLAFSASLAFEQSYGGIDGDSASGAEIVCLLSALTGVPVKQGLAMTGAIDQVGHLEAIGGVNEKIEGFFDACNYFGLTGEQGVVIPRANAGDLMLREDVVEACADGAFHVYAVDYILDALELMTGQSCGRTDQARVYATGSLMARAVERAEEFWKLTMSGPKRLSQVEMASAGDDEQPIPAPQFDRE